MIQVPRRSRQRAQSAVARPRVAMQSQHGQTGRQVGLGLGRQPRQLVVDEVQLAEHRESGERARLDAVQPAVLEIQLLQTGERTERVGRDVRDGVTLEAEYSHGRDVTEGRRRNGAQPVRLEVEDLEVAQSSERVWGDSLDVIAAEVDVLQGLVGVERVDAEERQLVVREL